MRSVDCCVWTSSLPKQNLTFFIYGKDPPGSAFRCFFEPNSPNQRGIGIAEKRVW